jgi:hypothetical protein
MVRAVNHPANLQIRRIVEQIDNSGQITRQEHLQLASLILSNYKLSEEERRKINQAFDQVQAGQLKLVD